MNFLIDYGSFLLETITLVIAILALVGGVLALASKNKGKDAAQLNLKNLSEHYQDLKSDIEAEILSKTERKAAKKLAKKNKRQQKSDNKATDQATEDTIKPRLFVLDFEGDMKASHVDNLRDEITAVLLTAKADDEVLLRLESPGGVVNGYGLAASQLQRLRAANIKLTIAVDKVAASGGYMMACVADQIIAAPFAIIGSIGVVAQMPNFHRLLDKHNIDFEQLTAGEYKRTLTMFGENTKKGRDKMQHDIEDIHVLFKQFIRRHRPQLEMDRVATGEYWFATRALDLLLVDELKTSDDFLLSASERFAIYALEYKHKQPLLERLGIGLQNSFAKLTHPGTSQTGQDYY